MELNPNKLFYLHLNLQAFLFFVFLVDMASVENVCFKVMYPVGTLNSEKNNLFLLFILYSCQITPLSPTVLFSHLTSRNWLLFDCYLRLPSW